MPVLTEKPVFRVDNTDLDAQATTNSYVDVSGSNVDTLRYKSLSFVVGNTDEANDLDFKVLASNDGTNYVEVQAEATVQELTGGTYAVTQAAYRYYKVQVKSTIAETPAEATVSYSLKQ